MVTLVCAHEMNVLSTVSRSMTVLPQTVTDINDMLTIVFVGAGNLILNISPTCLQFKKLKYGTFFYG